jgi:hypothetical protein
MSAQMRIQMNPRKFFFSSLPAAWAYGFVALLFLGWLAGMTAFPALSHGNPGHGTPACPWPLDNHGSITCVSHSTYERASAAGEPLAAGVVMGFFALHTGVAADDIVRRRRGGQSDDSPVVPQ